MQISTNLKIEATKEDLKRLTVVVRHGDKQQKLQVEKLTSDFCKIVEIYSASQQVKPLLSFEWPTVLNVDFDSSKLRRK